MGIGIEISIVYVDENLLALRIRAANQMFTGETQLYSTRSALRGLAKQIRGFPANTDDIRNWELGTFDPSRAGGGAKGEFRCIDRSGHALAQITLLQDEEQLAFGTVTLNMQVEPASIDIFVLQLEVLGANGTKIAELPASA